jgi:hypothetical protein
VLDLDPEAAGLLPIEVSVDPVFFPHEDQLGGALELQGRLARSIDLGRRGGVAAHGIDADANERGDRLEIQDARTFCTYAPMTFSPR